MTKTVYSDGKFQEEAWIELEADAELPGAGDLVLPLGRYLENRESLAGHDGKIAVKVVPGDEVEQLQPFLQDLPLILVEFPSFADGRGFSAARDLREHLNYTGNIRAAGKYILDQVPLARRCGVSSFEISKPEVLKALKAGEWPEVTKYLQPAFGAIEEVPSGTRPWAHRSHRDLVEAAE